MARRRRGRSVWIRVAVVAAFAVAMAYLESSVVVYLRALFHITGDLVTFTPKPSSVWFSVRFFTLLRPEALAKVLPKPSIANIEVGREAATIVMLLAVGWLAGKDFRSRAGYFLIAFGIWDIGYYAFLALLVGWPTSLASLDVLFLIPGPWLAPVWLPVLVSAAMIVGGLVLL